MTTDYDVVIAGGSISGLLAAREIAGRGLSVLVVEEDMEIGTPEHCGGLISLNGMRNLGIIPSSSIMRNSVRRAEIFSPSGASFLLDAEKQGVIAIDRRALDKQAANQARRNGAEIWLKCSMRSFDDDGEHSAQGANGRVRVDTTSGRIECKVMVDARGCQPMIEKNRKGALLSAQYEIYANWITKDLVEVYFDQTRYPGFFSWIIPSGSDTARAGAAGRAINTSNALNSFLEEKGRHAVVRKVFAPIWVLGPLDHFVNNRIVTIGDAAGQTKPTTAGGIYTCGMAGILAGRAIADAISERDLRLLQRYEREWLAIFKAEFERMLLARRVFEHLDNKAIDEIFAMVSSETIDEIAGGGDFDFHSKALSKLLSVEGAIKVAKTILGSEIRKLFA
ncbi:MAG: NAD(P)/FAD-dependent oxidoreductase [Nitrososphaerales archaeon]